MCGRTPTTRPLAKAAGLVVSLHERMAVDIPEADYPEMLTIDGAVAYLVEALRKPPQAAKNEQ